ncbi:MAG: AraC family transcriptional regulator [Alphaproteobacteria bacterium]|nr:AraC family transcriptional regulator [Alphaproteobacteria bacterium]
MIKNSIPQLSSKKILILDQDTERLNQLKGILEDQSVVVYVASSLQSMMGKAVFFKPHACIFSLAFKGAEFSNITEMLASNPSTAGIPLVYQADIQSLLNAYTNQANSRDHRFDFITWPYNPCEILLRLSLVFSEGQHNDNDQPEDEYPCQINEQCTRFDKIIFNASHKIIIENLSKNPPLKQLARMVGTNTKRLSQTFMRVCNLTVYQYVIEVKMKVAEKILRETDLDIRYISMDLGYSTQANFSTAFKHKYGVSPRSFRKGEEGHAKDLSVGLLANPRESIGLNV